MLFLKKFPLLTMFLLKEYSTQYIIIDQRHIGGMRMGRIKKMIKVFAFLGKWTFE